MKEEIAYNPYFPIGMQFLVALGFVSVTLLASWLLGPKVKTFKKDQTFESGIKSVGNARMQFSIKYFLVATLFVLFDVEVIFLYPWAVNFIEFTNGSLLEFWEMMLFMSTLLIGFFYVIKKGALEWE